MLIITIYADCPAGMQQGTKEAIAQALEHLGGIRVYDVKEFVPEQIVMEGMQKNEVHHPSHIQR